MKRIVRGYIIDTFSLYAASYLADGLIFEKGFITLLVAGVGLTISSVTVKPIINMLLLPLNLVTFGLLRWTSSAIILYLLTLVIKDFKINGFFFKGFTSAWIDIPDISFSGIFSYIGFALIIFFISSTLHWITK